MARMLVASALPEDLGNDRDEEEGVTRLPRGGRPLRLRHIAYACLGALSVSVATVLWHSTETGNEPMPAARLDRSGWADVMQGPRLFSLDTTRLPAELVDAGTLSYESRQRQDGEESKTILAAGHLDARQSYVRLVIHQGGRVQARAPTLFVELAIEAGEIDAAVLRADQPFLVPTRLGLIEVAQADLADAAGEGTCLGFRSAVSGAAVWLAGLACGPSGNAVSQTDLACIVDAVTLDGQDTPKELADFFRPVDGPRADACPGRPPTPLPVPGMEPPTHKTNLWTRGRKRRRNAV